MTRAPAVETPRSEERDDALRRRFTADEVLRMCECGVLGEDEHVELLDGALLVCEPQGPYHATSLQSAWRRLERLVEPAGAHARGQLPLRTDGASLPEPDVAVVRGEPRDYRDHHPTAADALLVVELALSSQALDRRKAERYARGGVPVYWLIDLAAGSLTVHERPDAGSGRYRDVRALGPDDAVAVPVPGLAATLSVADLLGRE